MIFEKVIKLGEESIAVTIDSMQPIDWNIRKLKDLSIITFKKDSSYPNTVVLSNIVGIDESLGVFVMGNRFGVYSGYVAESTGDLKKDVSIYVDSLPPEDRVPCTIRPTTYDKIVKDTTWITKILNNE